MDVSTYLQQVRVFLDHDSLRGKTLFHTGFREVKILYKPHLTT